MTTTSRNRPLLAAVLLLLLAAAAACSSSDEGSEPTTTLPSLAGTTEGGDPDDEDRGGTGTTVDEPRTGTTVIDPDKEPPTGDETEQDYVDALLDTFEEGDEELFTREDVECIAPRWVSAITVEGFQAAGVTPDDIRNGDGGMEDVVFDEETANQIVDAFPECDVELMTLFVEGLPSRVRDDPAAMACITDTVTDEQIREALIDDIMGAEGTDPEDIAAGCLE